MTLSAFSNNPLLKIFNIFEMTSKTATVHSVDTKIFIQHLPRPDVLVLTYCLLCQAGID